MPRFRKRKITVVKNNIFTVMKPASGQLGMGPNKRFGERRTGERRQSNETVSGGMFHVPNPVSGQLIAGPDRRRKERRSGNNRRQIPVISVRAGAGIPEHAKPQKAQKRKRKKLA